MAWVGLALVWLHASTNDLKDHYLEGRAQRSAPGSNTNTYGHAWQGWLHRWAAGRRRTPYTFKSIEHNISVYGFFKLLAQGTADKTIALPG